MDENEGMSDLVVFQKPDLVVKSNKFVTLLSKEKIIDMEVINFFNSFHHPAWRYGFFTGAFIVAIINLIYKLVTR